MSYLRGAAGYLLVVDGTRPETLETAASIQTRVNAEIGGVPFLVLLNKADLQEDWAIPRGAASRRWRVRAGPFAAPAPRPAMGVEASFEELAALLAR